MSDHRKLVKLYLDNPERIEYRLVSEIDDGEIVRHNPDGAAVEASSGYKAYYINGKRHRVGAPAIEFEGFEAWYENGVKHRVDKPAMIFSDGTKQYWEKGVRIK